MTIPCAVAVTLPDVATPFAALLDEHRDAVRGRIMSLARVRVEHPFADYRDSHHTPYGPIRFSWECDAELPSATLRLGPLAGMAGDECGRPTLDGGSLIVDAHHLDGVPDVVRNSLTGRRLGDLVTLANPFIEQLADLRIVGLLETEGAVRIRLDVATALWCADDI